MRQQTLRCPGGANALRERIFAHAAAVRQLVQSLSISDAEGT